MMNKPQFFKTLFFVGLHFILFAPFFAQEIKKENLTKVANLYYDFKNTQLQATGYYYKNELGETTEKHGKWKYFDRAGQLEEIRNYYRNNLQGQVLLYWPNKTIRQEGYFKYNQQDSIYKEWNEAGKLVTQGFYKKDEPVGKWYYYYRDGRLKSVEEVLAGENFVYAFYLPDSAHTQTLKDGNGELSSFYTNGKLKEYYSYKNGVRDGIFEEYSTYGFPTLTGQFKAGKKEGEWRYAYYTGDLEKISHYKNDLLDGEYRYYYDTGQLNVEGNYQKGQKTGKWIWYTNSGKKDQEGYFLEDQQDGKWIYYFPNGEISYLAEFKKGARHGFWSYLYQDGSKFKEGNFANDQKEGEWNTWYENGKLLMTGRFSAGKEEGEWKNFWDNGQLKNKSTFSSGELNGTWESCHISGLASLKGEYKNNYKTGEWTSYYDNGNPKELITYKPFTMKSGMDYGVMKDFERTDSERHGKYISYSQKDFKPLETGNYDKGKKDGEWISYHPGGKLPAVVSSFKEGQLHGMQKQFDRRGLLVSELEYKNGLRDGYFRAFDKKGKVVAERKYKAGEEVIEGRTNAPGFEPK